MDLTRRTFFKLAGVAGATAIAGSPPKAEASGTSDPVAEAVGVLVDTTLCIGCRGCEAACSEANGLASPAMPGDDAIFKTKRATDTRIYTVVNRYPGGAAQDGTYVKTQCMHCVEPACASACLVKALEKTPEGPVVYHAERCLGCRYCMVACPFDVPKFEYESAAPYVQKCSFCAARQAAGEKPACTEVCPSGALLFGKRKDLIEIAKMRIYQNPERYAHDLYGEHEVGGTSWLYLAARPFEDVGLDTSVGTIPYSQLTQSALGAVPMVMMLWPPLLMGLYTFSKQREALAAEASGDHKEAGRE